MSGSRPWSCQPARNTSRVSCALDRVSGMLALHSPGNTEQDEGGGTGRMPGTTVAVISRPRPSPR